MGRRFVSSAAALALAASFGLTGAVTGTAEAAATESACATNNVHLHHFLAGSEASQTAYVLTVTNVSTDACQVSGYLTVDLLRSHDHRLLRATASTSVYFGGYVKPGPLPVITLAPGASASAMLGGGIVDSDDHPCPRTWGIAVRLPGRATLVRMRFDPSVCTKVEITPLVPGLTGGHY